MVNKKHKVIIYSTSACPWCIVAKNFLKEKGIDFTEKNVEFDEKAAKEMIEKSGQMGVPVIEIDGNIIIGFNKKRIEELLRL